MPDRSSWQPGYNQIVAKVRITSSTIPFLHPDGNEQVMNKEFAGDLEEDQALALSSVQMLGSSARLQNTFIVHLYL